MVRIFIVILDVSLILIQLVCCSVILLPAVVVVALAVILTNNSHSTGLELCLWLVQRGARNLVITSRSGVTSGYQRWYIQRMEALGARVVVHRYDVCDAQQAATLVAVTTKELGPLGGVFHLAAVSGGDDVVFVIALV